MTDWLLLGAHAYEPTCTECGREITHVQHAKDGLCGFCKRRELVRLASTADRVEFVTPKIVYEEGQ